MRRALAWAGALTLLAACAPTGGDLSVQRVDRAALHVGPGAELVVRVQDRGQPLPADGLTVQADMLHPGMPSVPGTLTPLPDGNLRVGELNLTMAGDWVLTVRAGRRSGELTFRVNP